MNEVITKSNTTKWQHNDVQSRNGAFPDELLSKVAAKCYDFFKLSFSDGFMIVGSMNNKCPFKKIRLSGIKGFRISEKYVAIVMDSYVMLLDNNTGDVKVALKASRNFLQKIKCSLLRFLHR